MSVIKMTDLTLTGKRVLIRQDLNVPVKDGVVTSDQRIKASMPAIQHCIEAGAQLMIMSHLGRPSEGEFDQQYSMQPVADYLGKALGRATKKRKKDKSSIEVRHKILLATNPQTCRQN